MDISSLWAQHVGGHRVPFGVVAVQQPIWCPAVDLGDQFPADEVARAQLGAVSQLGGHPVFILTQPDQFAAAPDLYAELGGVLGQEALDGGLRNAEDIRMCGVQPVRLRLGDAGEVTTDRVLLAEREEPLQPSALVHHLDAARVQAERADLPGRLCVLLQHERMQAVQPQLAGEHHAGRSPAGNDYVDHHNLRLLHIGQLWHRADLVGQFVRGVEGNEGPDGLRMTGWGTRRNPRPAWSAGDFTPPRR